LEFEIFTFFGFYLWGWGLLNQNHNIMTKNYDGFSPLTPGNEAETKLAKVGKNETELNHGRQAVSARADLRRRLLEFKINAEKLAAENQTEADKARLASLYKEADGELQPTPEEVNIWEDRLKILRQKIEENAELFPNAAAYNAAQAAKLKIAVNENADEEIKQARLFLAQTKDLPKDSPTALLPDAILLGINKKIAEKTNLPALPDMAALAVDDEAFLSDCGLVIAEKNRADFAKLLPVEQTRRASVVMDNALSTVLAEKFIITDIDKHQRQAVLKRAQKTLNDLVERPESSLEAESKEVKILSRTLCNLAGEDSLRALQEIGGRGVAALADKEQNAMRIDYTVRIIRDLLEADTAKGGAVAMKFLGRNDLPQNIFEELIGSLTGKEVLTKKVAQFTSATENYPFLRKLIAEYPNQFNTVVDTLAKIKDYQPAGNEDEIFSAIRDLDSLTPIIFNRYRSTDAAGKVELARQIRELKPKFFRNVPIKEILPKKDREILAEMVYLSYQPVGMSFGEVEKFISRLNDHTADLEDYKFPEDGYDFELTTSKNYSVKEGEYLDKDKIRSYVAMFGVEIPKTEEQRKTVSALLARVAKAGKDFALPELGQILSIMNGDQPVRAFGEKYRATESDGDFYHCLNDLKEIVGVYFKDNYWERLSNFLGANPDIEGRILKIMSDPARQKQIEKDLSAAKDEIGPKFLSPDGKQIDWSRAHSREGVARIFSAFIYHRILKSVREDMRKSSNKFVESETGAVAEKKTHTDLKAYISKNVGSFFAKASAGICTSEDVGLFERDDHFHINIVENDEKVRANVQAYLINDDKGKSLVLRGFNPNTIFLNKIDPGNFCEAVLKIARQFARDNNLKHVYITEHLSGWHALSNRETVAKYLLGKYVKEKSRKDYHLQIASSQSVNHIYEV